eukprot:335654-Chlamydomonas_euryale.AAC.2
MGVHANPGLCDWSWHAWPACAHQETRLQRHRLRASWQVWREEVHTQAYKRIRSGVPTQLGVPGSPGYTPRRSRINLDNQVYPPDNPGIPVPWFARSQVTCKVPTDDE